MRRILANQKRVALIDGRTLMGQTLTNQKGITLIEMMVALVIIGVLAILGSANFIRLQNGAKRAVCLEQQRGLRTAGQLWANEQGFATGLVNVGALIASGYLGDGMAECPSSGTVDNDDYDLDFVDGTVVSITCTHQGPDHAF